MLSVAEFLVVFHKPVAWLISYLQTLQNGPAAFLLCWTVWIFLQEFRLGLLLLLLLCLFQPFSLLRLSQTESLDGFLWFLCCLSLQDSGWAGPMKCFPKPKSCNNFLVFPQKNYDFYRLADLKGVFKIMKKKCTC